MVQASDKNEALSDTILTMRPARMVERFSQDFPSRLSPVCQSTEHVVEEPATSGSHDRVLP